MLLAVIFINADVIYVKCLDICQDGIADFLFAYAESMSEYFSALISADKYRCIIAVYYLFKFFRVVFCCRSFEKIGTA